ncbi:hypothetical protein D3C76_1526950 [compost metagenome]
MRFTLTTVQQHLQMLGFGGHAQGDDIDAGQDFGGTHGVAPLFDFAIFHQST